MKITQGIDVTGHVSLTYDPASKKFKEALDGYKKCIDPDGDADDMLKHVAFYITRFGAEGMIEGVGYITIDDRKQTLLPDSGISVKSGYDEFEFDF